MRASLALVTVLAVTLLVAACGSSGPEPVSADEVLSGATAEEATPAAPPAEAPPAAEPEPPAEPAGEGATTEAAVSAAEPPAEPPVAPTEPAAAPVVCDEASYPSQVPLLDGSVHVGDLPEDFAYNSVPASQGPHSDQSLPWGIYREPVPEIKAVHNLEHGGVTVQYGEEVSQETVAAIVNWYTPDPNGIIVAPYPSLGDKVALAAWTGDPTLPADQAYRQSKGHLLTCNGFDEAAFSEFRDRYRAQAVERFPLEALAPGA